eukprot:s3648_g6.t1
MDGNEEDLHAHLKTDHAADLAPIAACMLRGNASDAYLSIYNQAVATVCRKQAPIAGASLDRRALHTFAEACEGDNVEALVCFSCACIYTHVKEFAKTGKGDIQWLQPLTREPGTNELRFFSRPMHETADILGLDAFLEHYDQLSEEGRRLSDHESFEQWSVSLPGGKKILCCPEDRDKVAPKDLCPKCVGSSSYACVCGLRRCKIIFNILAACRTTAAVGIQDMCMTGSCVKHVRCRFATSAKRSWNRASCRPYPWRMTCGQATRRSAWWNSRHRFGARGNALTFPLPLEELFRALQDHAVEVNEQQPLQLPRVGKELEHVVRVLLKTNKEGATNEQEIKTLIHQALVRREARVCAKMLAVPVVPQVCALFLTHA